MTGRRGDRVSASALVQHICFARRHQNSGLEAMGPAAPGGLQPKSPGWAALVVLNRLT